MLKKPQLQVAGEPETATCPPKPKLSLSEARHKYGQRVTEVLQNVFKHTSFRNDAQRDTVFTLLGNNDCFLIMPTGGGKSLCFQLPSLIFPGITLVVSPLIALMQNQVNALRAKGIAANLINSSQTVKERRSVEADLKAKKPNTKLLYVTPELLAQGNFLNSFLVPLYRRGLLSAFVIDESHCISQWGHDFRPAYMKLSILKTQFPDVPLLACTATATQRVQNDILTSLCIPTANKFMCSFNRPNIGYEIRYKELIPDVYSDMKLVIESFGKDATGIIYCAKRTDCDEFANLLTRDSYKAKAYHAGLKDSERESVLQEWTKGSINIIIATIAFGMGIDKADVRFVIHDCLPKSIEDFYQESGRAGRDGKPSKSIMYYSKSDLNFRSFLLAQEAAKATESQSVNAIARIEARQQAFQEMVQFCEGECCRREHLLKYFGEQLTEEARALSNPCCDWCTNSQLVSKQLELLRAGASMSIGAASIRLHTDEHSGVQAIGRGLGFVRFPSDPINDDEDDDGHFRKPSFSRRVIGSADPGMGFMSASSLLSNAKSDDELLEIALKEEKKQDARSRLGKMSFRDQLRAEKAAASNGLKMPIGVGRQQTLDFKPASQLVKTTRPTTPANTSTTRTSSNSSTNAAPPPSPVLLKPIDFVTGNQLSSPASQSSPNPKKRKEPDNDDGVSTAAPKRGSSLSKISFFAKRAKLLQLSESKPNSPE